jgi:hypothetical protein
LEKGIVGADLCPQPLDVFLTREATNEELAEILQDEPESASILSVVPIELDEWDVSASLG